MNQKVINQLVVDTYNLHFPRIEKELTKLAKLILEIKNNRPTPGGDIEIDDEKINEINSRIDELSSMLDSVSSNVDNISTNLSNYSSELSNCSSNVDTIISENQDRDQNINNLESKTNSNTNEITYTKNTLSSLIDEVNNYDITGLKNDVFNNANTISSLGTDIQNHVNEFNEFKSAYNQHVIDQSNSNVTFAQHVNDVSAIQLVINVDDGEYFNTEVVEDNVELNHNDLIQSLCFKVNGLIRNSLNELRAVINGSNLSEMKDNIGLIDDQITSINNNYTQLRTDLDITIGNVNSIVGRDDPINLSDGGVTSVSNWIPYYQTRIETYITKIEQLYEACTAFNESIMQHEHKIETLNKIVDQEEGKFFFNSLKPENNCFIIKAIINGKTRYIPALGDSWVRNRYEHLSDYTSNFDKELGKEIFICYNDLSNARSDFFTYNFITGVNKDTIKSLHFITDSTDNYPIYYLFTTEQFMTTFENIEEVHFAECTNMTSITGFDCPAMYFSKLKYFTFPKNLRTLDRYGFFGDNYDSQMKSTDFEFVYPNSLTNIGSTRIIYTPDRNCFYYPPNVRHYGDYSIVFPKNENLKCKNFIVKPNMTTDLSMRLFSLGTEEYIPNIHFERGCTVLYNMLLYSKDLFTHKFDIHLPYTIEYVGSRNFSLNIPQDPKPEIYVEGELIWKSVVENDKHVLKIDFRKMPNLHTIETYFLEVDSALADLFDFVEIEFPKKLKTIIGGSGGSDNYIMSLSGDCFEDKTKNKIIIYDQIQSISSSITYIGSYKDMSKDLTVEYRVKEGRTEEEYKLDPMYVFLSNLSSVTLNVATYKYLDFDY